MTILRVNTLGFAVGDKVTSSQMNGIDINPTFSLDKRAGQTDTLGSVIVASLAGRIIPSFVSGPDADTTFLIEGGNSTIYVSSLTADRTYTLSNSGGSLQAGDTITIVMIPTLTNFKVTVVGAAVGTLAVVGWGGSAIGADTTYLVAIHNGVSWRPLSSNKPPLLTPTTFTSNGTYVGPRGITLALLIGWGGGGAGGGGTPAGSTSTFTGSGGGGGGGAQQSSVLVALTPGTSYPVIIGAGGISGIASTPGGDGTPTTFNGAQSFAGAGGGCSSNGSALALGSFTYGGAPVALNAPVTTLYYTGRSPVVGGFADLVGLAAGSGGRGTNAVLTFPAIAGTPSAQGFAGGIGATFGASGGALLGGGGGGGGGGGPAAAGGAGGAGGAGSNGGTGSNGVAGTSGAANSGAGGGGGGAGGSSTGTPGTAAVGGAGGTGQLTVIPIR